MTPRGKKRLKIALGVVAAAIVAIQLVPVDRSNPAVTGDVGAPEAVAAILHRACYDCHSNETRWPWYAYVAPISWRVADHVHEGRKHLNFSEWGQYAAKRRQKKAHEVWEEVQEGAMPLSDYLWLHDDAHLSDSDRAAINAWVGTLGGADGDGGGEAREAAGEREAHGERAGHREHEEDEEEDD